MNIKSNQIFKDSDRLHKGYNFEMEVQSYLSDNDIEFNGNPSIWYDWLCRVEAGADITIDSPKGVIKLEVKFNGAHVYRSYLKRDYITRFEYANDEHRFIVTSNIEWYDSKDIEWLDRTYKIKVIELEDLEDNISKYFDDTLTNTMYLNVNNLIYYSKLVALKEASKPIISNLNVEPKSKTKLKNLNLSHNLLALSKNNIIKTRSLNEISKPELRQRSFFRLLYVYLNVNNIKGLISFIIFKRASKPIIVNQNIEPKYKTKLKKPNLRHKLLDIIINAISISNPLNKSKKLKEYYH